MTNQLRVTTWASGLDNPISLAFVDRSSALVLEKNSGAVRLVLWSGIGNAQVADGIAGDAIRAVLDG